MDNSTYIQTNRQYKDRLFCLIFGSEKNRKYLLELYNALNDTDYDDENMLEITTIQDVVYMGMKNDSSFIIDNELNLFEQQSTYNPNMPFREFEYCAKLLDKWVFEHRLNIYGKTLVKLPTPRCFVFYNGTDEHADREILKLSDAFTTPSEGCEWTVTMLNINKGHNLWLMNKCDVLKEYSDFVALVRENAKNLVISQAIERAVIAFIERGGALSDFLRAHRAEVVDVCITEYNEELHIKNVMDESRAEGISEGIAIGRNEGISIGRDEGISIGETRMSTLIGILASQHRYEDIVRISSDEAFRNECFALYDIP